MGFLARGARQDILAAAEVAGPAVASERLTAILPGRRMAASNAGSGRLTVHGEAAKRTGMGPHHPHCDAGEAHFSGLGGRGRSTTSVLKSQSSQKFFQEGTIEARPVPELESEAPESPRGITLPFDDVARPANRRAG